MRFARIGLVTAFLVWNSPFLWQASSDVTAAEAAADTKTKETTDVSGVVEQPDGSPAADVPVAIYSSRPDKNALAEIRTNAQGRFAATLSTDKRSAASAVLIAGDGQVAAIQKLGVLRDGSLSLPEEPIQVRLSAARQCVVSVVADDGTAIPEARVVLSVNGTMTQLRAKTDASGEAKFLLPNDSRVLRAIAMKDGAGFTTRSYVTFDRSSNELKDEDPPFNREGETLKMEGMHSITVRVVDSEELPVEDAAVYPWILNPPGETDSLNLSFYPEMRSKTNEQGLVTFPWIPKWQRRGITFWASCRGFTHRRTNITPGASPDEDGVHGIIRVGRLVELSGRVLEESGEPAANVFVSIGGQHDERHFVDVFTDAEGEYTTMVPPNMVYIVTARRLEDGSAKERRIETQHERVNAVSNTVTGFAVYPHSPHVVDDLTLRPPTIVTGTVVDQFGKPVVGKSVRSYHYGVSPHELEKQGKKPIPPSRYRARPTLYNYATTDDQGKYELRLGSGEFDVRPPGERSAQKFTISDDDVSDQVVDLVLGSEAPAKDRFTGRVIMPDGSPAANVIVNATSSSFRDKWKAKTDASGKFSVRERRLSKTLEVVTPDGLLAASVAVEASAASQEITLQSVGSADLTLVDETGDAVAHRKVRLDQIKHQKSRSGFITSVASVLSTDETGRVVFPSLVPGSMYMLKYENSPGKRDRRILKRFKVQPGEDYKDKVTIKSLLEKPEPLKANQPFPEVRKRPTTQELLARSLAVDGSPLARLKVVQPKLNAKEQKLLIVIGDSTTSELENFTSLRYSDNDYRRNSVDYATMVLATDLDKAGIESLFDHFGISDEPHYRLTLLMVDSEGTLLDRANALDLISDGTIQKDTLVEFLGRHPLELPLARDRLDSALSQAKREGKSVFVQETATWCGPCHALTGLMLSDRFWEKDYVYVQMDHRLEGARDVLKELRGNATGGCALVCDFGQRRKAVDHVESQS